MRLAWLALAGLALAACGDDPAPPAPPAAPPPRAAAKPAAPEPPRAPPLPAGMCCCDRAVRADRIVRVTVEAACREQGGMCAPAEACWVPDPPAVGAR